MTVHEKLDRLLNININFDITMTNQYHSLTLSCSGLTHINYELPAGGDTATGLYVTRSYNREPYIKTGSGASIPTTSGVKLLSGGSTSIRTGIIDTLGCDVLIIHGENMKNARYWYTE